MVYDSLRLCAFTAFALRFLFYNFALIFIFYAKRPKTDRGRELEDEQDGRGGAGPRARAEARTGERERSGYGGLSAVHRVRRSFQGDPGQQYPAGGSEHERTQWRRL